MRAAWRWLALIAPCLLLPAPPRFLHLSHKLDPSLLDRARDAIARSEYEARPNAHGLQAPNRANGLRTYFTSDGVSVQVRGGLGAPQLLDLSLSGVGRGARLAKVMPGEVTHEGARVEIRRPGLAEWYVNSPAGLEQGFTVQNRPEGDGALALELRFAKARATAHGAAELVFQAANGRSLRFGELRAQDAQGRALDARFELAGDDHLRLVVADAAAAYPVTIDPILGSSFDTSWESGQSIAFLGCSVAMGDVNGDGYADAVIGAWEYDAGSTETGAVFVFLGGASGIANGGPATASALLGGYQSHSAFGQTIAVGDFNGDGYADVAVSATGYGANGGVFVFPGSVFGVQDGDPRSAQTAILGTSGESIFPALAAAGDVNGDGYDDLLVTSSENGVVGLSVGLFPGGPSGIASGSFTSAATTISGPGEAVSAVAGVGDVNGDGYADVIVGNSSYVGAQTGEGAAYIFLGSASGLATIPATALSGTAQGQLVGGAVASAGDVNGDGYADVIVGAAGYSSTGAAFVFLGGPAGVASGTITNAATSLVSDFTDSEFGFSLAAGDVNGDGYSDVVVGAPSYTFSLGGVSQSGGAFVFLGGPSGIASTATLLSSAAHLAGTQQGEFFGNAAAVGDVNGDGFADVLIGAQSYGGASDTLPAEGAAYLSLGGPSYFAASSQANAMIESDQASANLGQTVVDAGDLNGDGFDDIAVGAPLFDLGEADEGIVLVFNGSANGLLPVLDPESANALIEGNQAGLELGLAIAGAGDVNGDGYGDLLVGAQALGSGGSALLYLGSPTGLPASSSPANASAVITSDVAGAQLGASVAGIGDVNGDGFADVAIGAPNYDNAHSGGAVFVFDGSLAGIGSGSTATASARLVGGQAGLGFGTSLAGAGDVNGDGYSDLAIGVPGYSNGQSAEGAVLVYQGSASGIASGTLASANTRLESNQSNASLGQAGGAGSIASAGDFNGDGYDDLLIGDAALVTVTGQQGEVLLYRGGPSGIPSGAPVNASATFPPLPSGSGLGDAVAGIGDLNGDGFADVAVGANLASDPLGQVGAFFVVFGNAKTTFSSSNGETMSTQVDSDFAYALAGADVNGDGYSDVLVGAPLTSDFEAEAGRVFAFYGNLSAPGRTVRLRQRRTDTASALVAPLGRSVTLNGFSVDMIGVHPNGRGRVAGAFQACPRGTAFGGVSCVSATTSYSQVGGSVPSAVLATTFSGLASNTLYHWRGRLLYVDSTGPIPPNPAHGPWRRPGARAAIEDLRTGADTDGDGVPDAIDNCPLVANANQADTGGMGPGSAPDKIGDACQCGSVSGDGHVDATDVAAYRAALANPTGAGLSSAAQTRCRVLGRTGGCTILQVTAIRRAIASPSLAPIQSGPAAQSCVAALGS